MTKKMLIDASHPEETRVVIVDGNRVEELDFESRNKRQIRGNVYLARVTRVEPSLQAAFVEYGGNRHGFLAFSEIHPDYYQIPHEDKVALLKAEEAEHKEAEAEEDEKAKKSSRRKSSRKKDAEISEDEDTETDEDEDEADDDSNDDEGDRDENVDPDAEDAADAADEEVADEQAKVASTRRRRISRRRYKIQEVIKRGQILLIQAVKEERGNKGAAMTSYLSLAGRYCVLMPNTARGGGISRKISNGTDRKRLKSVMSELEVPQGMGVIVRTAGAKRTKAEIKRDYDYLSRLWDTIRDTTMKSIAPALIHEEGNLVKRSIRDLYNKNISEILVQGNDAYKTAKAFIKMLMPSHAKNVKAYKDEIPLYLRYNVERQIEDSLKSVVQLKSGGYLVIHPTEALVSIDVNSGRSTKERNVERTALKTNLETADEVARQMRLRDLAGLIVIDFIDMDEHRNNRAVERRMKEALTQDRARVQTSKISQFGLMEISRQRRRRSLLEGSTAHCEHCEGVGRKRTIESSALAAIRAVEEIGARGKAKRIRLKVSADVALYIFNEKRDLLQHVDDSFGVFTELVGEEDLIRPAYEIDVIEEVKDGGPDPLAEIEKEFRKQRNEKKKPSKRRPKKGDDDESEDDETEPRNKDDDNEDGGRKKRRRRRGRRGGRDKRRDETRSEEAKESEDISDALEIIEPETEEPKDEKPKRGRRRKAPAKKEAKVEEEQTPSEDEKPKRKRTTRKAPARKPKAEDGEEKPKKTRRKATPKKAKAKKAKASESEDTPIEAETPKKAPRSSSRRKAPSRKAVPEEAPAEKSEEKPKRSTARRKAPARKKAESTEAKAKPKRKSAPRKKAAAKAKTEPVSEPEAPTEDKPKRSTSRRKAPVRQATASEEMSISTEVDAVTEPKTDKPKKRGWFGRKKT